MNISTAGPTVVTSKAKDALAFYATHFGLTANDYGAGDDCWYWTFTFGEHSELSFMLPQNGEPEFTGQGMFYYVELADNAGVDALRERMIAEGVEVSAPKEENHMYQYWVTDPVGLRVMAFAPLPLHRPPWRAAGTGLYPLAMDRSSLDPARRRELILAAVASRLSEPHWPWRIDGDRVKGPYLLEVITGDECGDSRGLA